MADRGILVVVAGPPKSGRSTLASDEVLYWLRRRGEGRVILIDIGTDYHNDTTIEADLAEGYHVCVVTGGVPSVVLGRKAEIVIHTDVRTEYRTSVTKNRDDIDVPWGAIS